MSKDLRHEPYKGSEPYIFISYSHRDDAAVMEIITRMQEDGYRVWYDNALTPGADYTDDIADHILGCSCFIGVLTESYAGSDFCRDELNMARDEKKDFFMIILSEFKIPSGLRMSISRRQNLCRYNYSSDEEFYSKLYESQALAQCRDKSASVSRQLLETLELNDAMAKYFQLYNAAPPVMQKEMRSLRNKIAHASIAFTEDKAPSEPEKKYHLILAVDTSGSMCGNKIKYVNEGLRLLFEERDSNRKDVDITAVSFSSTVGFFTKDDLPLKAYGFTALGDALRCIADLERKNHIHYEKTTFCTITDGFPDSGFDAAWEEVLSVPTLQKSYKLIYFLEDNDVGSRLSELMVHIPTMILKDGNYEILPSIISDIIKNI